MLKWPSYMFIPLLCAQLYHSQKDKSIHLSYFIVYYADQNSYSYCTFVYFVLMSSESKFYFIFYCILCRSKFIFVLYICLFRFNVFRKQILVRCFCTNMYRIIQYKFCRKSARSHAMQGKPVPWLLTRLLQKMSQPPGFSWGLALHYPN